MVLLTLKSIWQLCSHHLSGNQYGCQKQSGRFSAEVAGLELASFVGSSELLHSVSGGTRQRTVKPVIIHGIAEDAASAESWQLSMKWLALKEEVEEFSLWAQHSPSCFGVFSFIHLHIFCAGNGWGAALLLPCTDLNSFLRSQSSLARKTKVCPWPALLPVQYSHIVLRCRVSERLSCTTSHYQQSSGFHKGRCTRWGKSFVSLGTCSTRTGLYRGTVFRAYMRGYIPKYTKTSLCLKRREFILLVNFLV